MIAGLIAEYGMEGSRYTGKVPTGSAAQAGVQDEPEDNGPSFDI